MLSLQQVSKSPGCRDEWHWDSAAVPWTVGARNRMLMSIEDVDQLVRAGLGLKPSDVLIVKQVAFVSARQIAAVQQKPYTHKIKDLTRFSGECRGACAMAGSARDSTAGNSHRDGRAGLPGRC